MIEIGTVLRYSDLKIWLTNFDDQRYYLENKDIERVKSCIERYLAEKKAKPS